MKNQLKTLIKKLSKTRRSQASNNDVAAIGKDINQRYKRMLSRLTDHEITFVEEADWDDKLKDTKTKLKKTLNELKK